MVAIARLYFRMRHLQQTAEKQGAVWAGAVNALVGRVEELAAVTDLPGDVRGDFERSFATLRLFHQDAPPPDSMETIVRLVKDARDALIRASPDLAPRAVRDQRDALLLLLAAYKHEVREFNHPEQLVNVGSVHKWLGVDVRDAGGLAQMLREDGLVTVRENMQNASAAITMKGLARAEELLGGTVAMALSHTSFLEGEDFAFVRDPAVRSVLMSAAAEVRHCLRAGLDGRMGAPKAAIVLCGSVVEGVLSDALIQRRGDAMANPQAPRRHGRNGPVREITSDDYEDQWTFAALIRVAVDLALVTPGSAAQLHAAVREFRNLIHPRLHAASGVVTAAEEAISVAGSVAAVVRDVRASLVPPAPPP
jgi:hypothetical protein